MKTGFEKKKQFFCQFCFCHNSEGWTQRALEVALLDSAQKLSKIHFSFGIRKKVS